MKNDNEASNAQPAFGTAKEAVEWVTGLMPTVGIRPGLERMNLLMEKLGNPQRRLKFIHVAGTNGKGSVCAYLNSVLRKAGYDVGMFTSPYITSYANRLQYNGEDIPGDDLVRLANRLKPLSDEMAGTEWGPLTMFEVTTALAILYFGTVSYPDYVVWETGMGGRLDVTNIVVPVVSVITNIGHDHMDLLGPTLGDVAAEKAGIIKAGVPVVSSVEQPEMQEIIRRTAESKRAALYQHGDKYRFETLAVAEDETSFAFEGPFRRFDSLAISLNGAHQVKNAAAAVMTLEVLRQYYALIVEDDALEAGLRETAWPGRLEMVSRSPRILVDGAHNPEGMQALADALRDVYAYDRLNMVIAMMPNKNHDQALKHILPMVDGLIVTEPDFHKKMKADELAGIARKLQEEFGAPRTIAVEPDWRRALELLRQWAEEGGERTLSAVTGTLYLIADARSWLLHRTNSEKGW